MSYLSLGLTVGTGAGLVWWYNHEKEQKLEDISREGKSSVVVGQVRPLGCWPALPGLPDGRCCGAKLLRPRFACVKAYLGETFDLKLP